MRARRMTGWRSATLASVVALAVFQSPATAGPEWWRIDRLTHEIQGKSPGQVRALIVARFGLPARNVGSGLQIEQWDVDGGVLTFHPMNGPTFYRDGVSTRLIRTTNPAALCLFGSYEMVTRPEGPHGMKYWLGNVSVLADARYEYTDSRANLENRAGQTENFFMRHPRGSTRVRWAPGVTAETRLEELADGSPVAAILFVSESRQSRKVYRIVADRSAMRLAFEDEAMPFQLDRAWVNYWR